jgi:hypothetical protein
MDNLKQTDILQMLTLIRANYDNAYANTSDEEAQLLVKFWYESLKDYPRTAVLEGTKNAIRNSEFPPRLANIIDEVKKLTACDTLSDEQLWGQLVGVLGRVYNVSRYLQYPQHHKWANDKLNEIYKGLDANLKLYVVNTSSLVEISELEPEALSFEKARFFKHMPLLRKNNENALNATKFIELCNAHPHQQLKDKNKR